jgi:hypothetical protein
MSEELLNMKGMKMLSGTNRRGEQSIFPRKIRLISSIINNKFLLRVREHVSGSVVN